MINKSSKHWKEALFDDKMRQERGFKSQSEIDLIATTLYFERVHTNNLGLKVQDLPAAFCFMLDFYTIIPFLYYDN